MYTSLLLVIVLYIFIGKLAPCISQEIHGEGRQNFPETVQNISESTSCIEKCFCLHDMGICKKMTSRDFKDDSVIKLNFSKLSIRDSDFTYVTNNTFRYSAGLKDLRLTRSKVRFVTETAFDHLPLLETISLSQNDIEAIGRTASRKYLFLEKNTVHLPDYIQAADLRDVDLSGNRISEISTDALYGMKYVKYLNLSRNQLTKITPGFTKLMGIKVLDLRDNQISDIDQSFGGYQLLMKELYLSGNHISKMPNLEDYCCSHLSKIDLGLNQLQTVNLAGVRKCQNLLYLNLHGNKISELNVADFQGNVGLQNLFLENNVIMDWSDETFMGNKNLEELNMNGNLVAKITARGLAGLINLKIFEIANNEIEEISPSAFDECVWLNYINLAGNRIRYIEPSMFKKLSLLKLVNLESNKLKVVHAEWFLIDSGQYYIEEESKTVKEKIAGSLASFKLEDNLWTCDCQSRDLIHWVSTQTLLDTRLFPVINCVYPYALRGKNLFGLAQDHLTCDKGLFSILHVIAFHFSSILLLFIFLIVLIWKKSKR